MALVEPVAREELDEVEELGHLGLVVFPCRTLLDELGFLFGHLRFVLLAHGAAQHVRLA